MTQASNDIVHAAPRQPATNQALDVIAFGKVVSIDDEIRHLLPRVATGIGQRFATGRHATHEDVARLCVVEAFGTEGTIDSGSYQRRCDVAFTLYANTISLLTGTSRLN